MSIVDEVEGWRAGMMSSNGGARGVSLLLLNWRPLLWRSREFVVVVVRTRRRVKRLARALVVVALRAELIAVAWLARRHDAMAARMLL